MIKIKLSEQLGKRRMSRRELAQLIGVRPNTIGDMPNSPGDLRYNLVLLRQYLVHMDRHTGNEG